MSDEDAILEAINRNFQDAKVYKIMAYIYPQSLLDGIKKRINIKPQDWEIIKLVRKMTKNDPVMKALSYDEKLELIIFSVMTNDESDVLFVQNNDMCKRCGWCCKNCYPIELKEEEIPKVGMRNVEPFDTVKGKKVFHLKTPCNWLKNDNTCSIYEDKPYSCGTYPLGVSSNGNMVIQRNPHCGYIMGLLEKKVLGLGSLAIKRREELENAN